MRYWVYKDSQILGPLAKEDFGLAGGVRPETLVCAEDNAGRMEADWRCAEDVGELSSLCAAAPAPVGEDIVLEPGFGLLERPRFGTRAFPGEGDGEGWLTDLPSPASRIPAAYLPRPDESKRQELKNSRTKVQELTAQIELLRRRLTGLETAPRQAPAPPKEAAAAAPPQPAPPPPAPPPAPAPPPEVAAPAPEELPPPVQESPALAPEHSPYRWDTQPAPGGGLPQVGSAPPPAQEPLAPAATPMTAGALPKGRPRRVVKVSAPQSLRKVEKSGPPSLPAEDKAPGTLPPPQPGTAGPAPLDLSAPPAAIVPGAVMPQLTSPPQPVLPPPPTFAPPAQTMAAPPIPALVPSAPTPAALPPMTMAFSGATVMPPPAAGPSTQEVLAKLAKPAPAKTEPPQAPKGSPKTFLIIIGAASAVVVAAAWFFLFRDSKGLKTALQMDSGRPPVGAEVSDESAGAAKPQSAAPVPPAAQTAPQAATQPVTAGALPNGQQAGALAEGQRAAPAPASPAPAAQAEAIRDERPTAVAMVKEFPLDGDRGTIGQWLQYSFAATPGAQIEEKWDAGAYEENTYAVKYTVQPAGKDAITYLFEADLARKTVKGMNATARELLAGRSPARGKSTAKARPAKPKKRAPPRRAAAPAPKAVPLLPLPSDAELTPPAEDESAFRSDTVQPNP